MRSEKSEGSQSRGSSSNGEVPSSSGTWCRGGSWLRWDRFLESWGPCGLSDINPKLLGGRPRRRDLFLSKNTGDHNVCGIALQGVSAGGSFTSIGLPVHALGGGWVDALGGGGLEDVDALHDTKVRTSILVNSHPRDSIFDDVSITSVGNGSLNGLSADGKLKLVKNCCGGRGLRWDVWLRTSLAGVPVLHCLIEEPYGRGVIGVELGD